MQEKEAEFLPHHSEASDRYFKKYFHTIIYLNCPFFRIQDLHTHHHSVNEKEIRLLTIRSHSMKTIARLPALH